jgi:hypothetical protein
MKLRPDRHLTKTNAIHLRACSHGARVSPDAHCKSRAHQTVFPPTPRMNTPQIFTSSYSFQVSRVAAPTVVANVINVERDGYGATLDLVEDAMHALRTAAASICRQVYFRITSWRVIPIKAPTFVKPSPFDLCKDTRFHRLARLFWCEFFHCFPRGFAQYRGY